MQWLKYMFYPMAAIFLAWSAWMLYTKQYAAGAAMLVSALVVIAIYVFVLHPHARLEALAARLQENGLRTQAVVLSVTNTSSYLNEIPVMRVSVRYVVNGKEHREEVKQPIPFQFLASVQPGNRVPVLVDPDRSTEFVLSF